MGRSAAALVNKFPLARNEPRPLGHQAARFGELNFVAAVLRHRQRDAVSSEEYLGGRLLLSSDLRETTLHRLDHRLDKAGMIVEDSQFVDSRRGGANFFLCGG